MTHLYTDVNCTRCLLSPLLSWKIINYQLVCNYCAAYSSRTEPRRVRVQVAAHTHVPLSTSSIIWYWPMNGDALKLGR